ncbi:hypothetical protein [Amycolatopsis sp. FDAARGOS 1241]|nr:hypothetical protein [Amycolatopsis sp. FDAARGOS 1241]
MTAARRGNDDTDGTLLAILEEDTAMERWEVEGGRIPVQSEPVDA